MDYAVAVENTLGRGAIVAPKLDRMQVAGLVSFFVAAISFFRGSDFDYDYENYELFFREVQNTGAVCYKGQSFEPLFSCIFYVLNPLGVDVVLFLVVWAALAVKFYVVLRLDVRAFVLFLPLYLTGYFLIHELNQTRLAVALAPIYLIYFDKMTGAPMAPRHFLLLMAAFFLHYSSILLGLFILLSPIGVGFYILTTAFLIFGYYLLESGILFELLGLLGDERIHGYVKELTSDSGAGINFFNVGNLLYVYIFLLTSCIYVFSRGVCRYKKIYANYIYLSIIGFLFYYVFKEVPVIATRMAELMRAFSPLVAAMMIRDVSRGGPRDAVFVIVSVGVFVLGSFFMFGPSVKPIGELLVWLGLSRDI